MSGTERMAPPDSLPKIIRKIPSELMVPTPVRSFYYLAEGLVICLGLGALIVIANSWIVGVILSLFLGAALGGLFVVGHDCGHRSFAKSVLINNAVGHCVTSLVCWPFHIWRKDHDLHHRYTGHLDRDTAWRPVTYRLWKRMAWFNRMVYLWTRVFFFLGAFYTTFSQIRDALRLVASGRYSGSEKKEIVFSVIFMTAVVAVYGVASFLLGGWYGFVCLFLIPQCVFQFLLSTFTFFHHTHPDVRFMNKKNWSPEKAQLCTTVHVNYPHVLEYLVRDINWHIPHHVCVGIPHYNLRKAHSALRFAYPDYIKETEFNFSLVWEVARNCHFISSKLFGEARWVSYQDAVSQENERLANKKVSRPRASI